MKGTILKAAKQLVVSKFGKNKWEQILIKSNLEPDTIFLIRDDVPDELVLQIFDNACKILGITLEQLFEAFANYWISVYINEVYPAFAFDNAKEFILNIDEIHKIMTEDVPNAHPPEFEYDWQDEKTLIITYKSKRGFIDLVVFMLIEIGRKYKTELNVEKLNEEKVKVEF